MSDLRAVIKETVENSMDAEATSISIVIDNYGIGGVVIKDNGKGMSRADLGELGQFGASSKLQEYE